jgi:hypothetical protein
VKGGLAALLADPARSGVYALEGAAARADVPALASRHGLALQHVDLSAARTKDDLMEALAAGLHFPAWFGRNWDALEEALSDLSWLGGDGVALLLEEAGALARADRAVFDEALDVLRAAAAAWAEEGKPFFALLRGAPRGAAPAVRG